MTKKRIGFLSYWGWARGQSYLTLCYAKMLQGEYDVYILKQGEQEIAPEFKTVDVNVTEYPKYVVDKDAFKLWVKENKLDAVIFNEYNQWGDDEQNLVAEAKALGAKAYGWHVLEKFGTAEDYKDYDALIASTVTHTRVLRRNKLRNFAYIPYSVDLTEFPEPEKKEENKQFTFFHPGGYLGVNERKNTRAVIEGFIKLNDKNTKLIITAQQKVNFEGLPDNIEIINEDLPRKELIELYYKADAVVLPSKWETIGLPILESLASGTPVITNDVPPMNEFIKEGFNGYLCTVILSRYHDIFVPVAEITSDEIKKKMINMMNPLLHSVLKRNCRTGVKQLYDLKKNKKYFLDFLKSELK